MRISSLQIGLIVAGLVLVAGVILYNRWVLRRARRRDAVDARPPASVADRAVARVEPSLGTAPDESPIDADLHGADTLPPPAPAAEPAVVAHRDDDTTWQVPMDSVATLPPAARADSVRHDRRDGALTQPDPDIESVVVLRPPAAVGVSALAAGLHARLGKPLRWFGRREPSLAWQRLTADTPGEFAEIVACLLLADRSGPATHNQIDAYLRMLRELAPSLPATFAAPPVDDEAARAEALDRLCAELDMQIGITIERTDGSPIAGTRLRGVAEAAGFRLAPSGRFEWVQEETGHVAYTMQAISGEPFTLDTLRTASLGGIVFVLDVPCVNEPARAFDQMKLAAGRLAHTLGGDMVDDNRRVLTDEALANTRAAVAKAAAALAEVHIEPGSPRALKLFSA
ncbi:MAG TPA: cell division protein ZipA C-terminal FtsZ-binding domain-containing protein [Casimicrobiaceae bacterium]|nr:cell division protein ZipA C-terminal FtsZ-binding domain-containing protein [Casimicrobiaceae bacterium]